VAWHAAQCTFRVDLVLRVLTWNLFHGRSVPGAGRDLCAEFTAALAGWEWDVALLQEVPPWWPAAFALALGCEQRSVLTSRNGLLALRRFAARRAPDLMRSGGGGCNAILARSDRIVAERSVQLCRHPERRVAHGVALACGLWVTNLHATAHDSGAAERDLGSAVAATVSWARETRTAVVLGGDLNLRAVSVDGLTVVGSSDVDHVLIGQGLSTVGEARVLERGTLSDHAPLAVGVELPTG
jgi:endonuclease/exonuclease/phosphatase family metal-dependent hydrolase